MRRAVILTTINVPTNLRAWRGALSEEDVVIVAGDLKTPHLAVKNLLQELPGENIYLTPERQHERLGYNRLSEYIGWNSIQRRNIALLEAIKLRPDYIFSLDDDNFCLSNDFFNLADSILDGSTLDQKALVSQSGWYNAGVLCNPAIVLRGYPIPMRDRTLEIKESMIAIPTRVGVLQSMVMGDPDIDAITRICDQPIVTSLRIPGNRVLAQGTWCPFNSQATAFRTELAPLMAVWPGVGRYDDIWASFFAQKIMHDHGWHVAYGYPLVTQARNTETGAYQRNHVSDLEHELLGMRHTTALCDILRGVDKGKTIQDSVWNIIFALKLEAKFLPSGVTQFLQAWWGHLDLVEGHEWLVS